MLPPNCKPGDPPLIESKIHIDLNGDGQLDLIHYMKGRCIPVWDHHERYGVEKRVYITNKDGQPVALHKLRKFALTFNGSTTLFEKETPYPGKPKSLVKNFSHSFEHVGPTKTLADGRKLTNLALQFYVHYRPDKDSNLHYNKAVLDKSILSAAELCHKGICEMISLVDAKKLESENP